MKRWCPSQKCGKKLVQTDQRLNKYTWIYQCLKCKRTFVKCDKKMFEIIIDKETKKNIYEYTNLLYSVKSGSLSVWP